MRSPFLINWNALKYEEKKPVPPMAGMMSYNALESKLEVKI